LRRGCGLADYRLSGCRLPSRHLRALRSGVGAARDHVATPVYPRLALLDVLEGALIGVLPHPSGHVGLDGGVDGSLDGRLRLRLPRRRLRLRDVSALNLSLRTLALVVAVQEGGLHHLAGARGMGVRLRAAVARGIAGVAAGAAGGQRLAVAGAGELRRRGRGGRRRQRLLTHLLLAYLGLLGHVPAVRHPGTARRSAVVAARRAAELAAVGPHHTALAALSHHLVPHVRLAVDVLADCPVMHWRVALRRRVRVAGSGRVDVRGLAHGRRSGAGRVLRGNAVPVHGVLPVHAVARVHLVHTRAVVRAAWARDGPIVHIRSIRMNGRMGMGALLVGVRLGRVRLGRVCLGRVSLGRRYWDVLHRRRNVRLASRLDWRPRAKVATGG